MTKVKLSILRLLALFLITCIFVACSKGDNEQILEAKTQKGTGLVDPVEFGKLHNKYLLQVLNTSNYTNKSNLSSTKKKL